MRIGIGSVTMRWGLMAAAMAFGALAACDDDESETEAASAESATSPEEAPSEEAGEDACVASATAAIGQLQRGLKTRLVAAMGEGAPAAVRVCADEAEAIRAHVAQESGVRVGRTSTKLRNPANAEAPPWAKAYLESPAREDGAFVHWVERTPTEARVVSPLVAQGLCLTCHGEAIPPEVAEVLDERYPEDEARGFAEGDLRGVAWAIASCDR